MFPRPLWTPSASSAYAQQVRLLMDYDGTDASTTFVDLSTYAHFLAAVGTAQLDTAQQVFGPSSYLGDGSTSSCNCGTSTDYDTPNGTTPFTVEAFVRFSSVAGDQAIFGRWFPPTDGFLFRMTSGNLEWFNFAGANFSYNGWNPTTGVWYYTCLEFDGTKSRIYTDDGAGNAVMRASHTHAQQLVGNITIPFGVGSGDGNTGFGRIFNGWIDEFRFMIGIANYATDTSYPVPVAAFPIP